MKALVLQRNPAIGRRVARLWRAAGLEVEVLERLEDLPKHLSGVRLLGAQEFDRAAVQNALSIDPYISVALWTTEPLLRSLRFMADVPRCIGVLGCPDHEQPPSDWDVSALAWRAQRSAGERLPFEKLMFMEGKQIQRAIASTSDMEQALHDCHTLIKQLGLPQWIDDTFSELVHELLMNALYDAPVDSMGKPLFAHNRKARVHLKPGQSLDFRAGSDGLLLGAQIVDPFGRLRRAHIVDGLIRGLNEGVMDESGGGAGLGMAVCHNSSVSMIYEVEPGTRTEVTGLMNLELTRREFRSRPRSLHVFWDPSGSR